jgi:hypothetical protein
MQWIAMSTCTAALETAGMQPKRKTCGGTSLS